MQCWRATGISAFAFCAIATGACETTHEETAEEATTRVFALGPMPEGGDNVHQGDDIEEALVCRRERMTGSLIVDHICVTLEEWERNGGVYGEPDHEFSNEAQAISLDDQKYP